MMGGMPTAPWRRSAYDREILRLALPAFGALVAEPLYVLADTAVVGHLGSAQLAGVAVAGTVLTSSFWIFNFLASGTGAVVARRLGADDRRCAVEHAVQAHWTALGLGLAVAAVGLLIAPYAVRVFTPDEDVRAFALLYLRISLLGAPAFLTILAGVGLRRGLQDTVTPLVVVLVSNGANLALELLLIYGLGMGVGASAFATVVAQYSAATTFLVLLRRTARAEGASLRPDGAGLRHVAVFGGFLTVRTSALVGAFAVATAIAGRLGTTSLAAHQIAWQIWLFLAFALDAIAIAAEAMTGRALGAGRPREARDAANRMLGWGLLTGVSVGVLVVVGQPLLAAVFTDDPAVRALAEHTLWFVAAMQPLNAVVFVLDGVLIGAGDVRYVAAAMLVSFAAFVPAAIAALEIGGTLGWLWAAIILLLVVRAATTLGRFVTDRWQLVGETPGELSAGSPVLTVPPRSAADSQDGAGARRASS